MKITRREAIKLGLIGGGGLLLSQDFPSEAWAQSSPQIDRFKLPFQMPPVLKPIRSYEGGDRPIDIYQITMRKNQVKILPGEKTQIWGYEGMIPGPIIRQRGGFRDEDRGRSSLIRFINKLGTTLEEGEEVPISTTVHLHGMASLPQYDGHAEDLSLPGYFKDYFYPNDRAATIWYHDHAIDRTSRNVYMGLAGMYIVEDEEERQLNLPKGKYDVPLILQDLKFASDDNRLIFNDRNQQGLYADVILVNGVPWPYMKVARRKYRFRVLNASTSRSYQLVLSKEENKLTRGDKLFVIGTDCGLLSEPVELESPLKTLQLFPAERYEFIIDFAQYPLHTQVFLRNPSIQSNSNFDRDTRVQTLMRFDVELSEPDDSDLPDHLRDFEPLIDKIPSGQEVPLRTFVFGRGQNWTINGKIWNKNRVDANPEPGAIEIWKLVNQGGWDHPVHIHFTDWQILDRNGRSPRAYERGWKDVFRVGHFETVRVIARFSTRNGEHIEGKYMFHCHNLVHEDHSMMSLFEVGKNGDSPFSAPPQPISEMQPL